jgi:hypothetical protein
MGGAQIPIKSTVHQGRGGQGEVRSAASLLLLADMLGGALCAVALLWLRTRWRKKLDAQLEEVVRGCRAMIEA